MKNAANSRKLKAFFKQAYWYIKQEAQDLDALRKKELMKGYSTVPVDVNILEIEWLSTHTEALYIHMAKQTDNEIFGNSFIKVLLEGNSYSMQLFWKMFLPYLIYASLSLVYMSDHMIYERCDGFMDQEYKNGAIYRFLIVIMGGTFLIIEVVQMVTLKEGYFDDFWNFFLFASYVLNIYCVFEHVYSFSEISFDGMVNISSCAVAL